MDSIDRALNELSTRFEQSLSEFREVDPEERIREFETRMKQSIQDFKEECRTRIERADKLKYETLRRRSKETTEKWMREGISQLEKTLQKGILAIRQEAE